MELYGWGLSTFQVDIVAYSLAAVQLGTLIEKGRPLHDGCGYLAVMFVSKIDTEIRGLMIINHWDQDGNKEWKSSCKSE